MNRNLVCCLIALVAAVAAALLEQTPLVPPPATNAPTRSEQFNIATGITATGAAAEASATSERAPAASPPAIEPAATSPLTFRMTGAPTHELHGTASVRRNDDTTVDEPFTAGQLTIADRDTLNGVALRVPGFAIVWPTLDKRRDQIEVPMQRAGSIRVRLTDSSGALLADRGIWCTCQRSDVVRPGNCQANARAVTDAAGIATLGNLVPGNYDLGTCRLGEWDAVKSEGVTVTADCITTFELVAPLLQPTRYGGFYLPLPGDGTFARGANNTVTNFVFATSLGCYEINAIGDQLRCVARGRQGDVIVGRIAAYDEGVREDLGRSAPITITIGAVFSWLPVWERAYAHGKSELRPDPPGPRLPADGPHERSQ